jgi:hypothetical protein
MLKRYWKWAAAPALAVAVSFTHTDGAFAQRGGGRGPVGMAPTPGTGPARPGTLSPANTPNGTSTPNGNGLAPDVNQLPPLQPGFSPIGPNFSTNPGPGLNSQANINPAAIGQLAPGLSNNITGLAPGTQGQIGPGLGFSSTGFNPINQGFPTAAGFNQSLFSYNGGLSGGFFSGGGGYGGYPYPNQNYGQQGLNGFYQPAYASFTPPPPPPPPDITASLRVLVPETAQLFIDGKQVDLSGNEYVFKKDKMPTDHAQSVVVKATWKHGSDTIVRDQKVQLIPGEHKSVFIVGYPEPTEKSSPSSDK